MTAGPRPSGWLPAGRGWLPALAAGAVTIVIAAGCVGAGPSGGSPAVTAARPSTPIATPSAPVTPPASIEATAAPAPSLTRPPSAPPDPSGVVPTAATPAGFPRAVLVGGTDAEVPATLGSYTWDGTASDTPWLPAGALPTSEVEAGAALGVRVDGAVVDAWAVDAAPAADPGGVDLAAVGEGTGPAISFPAPTAGDVVILVHATFVDGGDAAWYWHIVVR